MKYEYLDDNKHLFTKHGGVDENHTVAVMFNSIVGRNAGNGIKSFNTIEEAMNTSIVNMYVHSVAMRRIIKEPKRWTVADQKAGLLPEVGAEFQTSIGKRKCVITEGKFIFTVNDNAVEVFTIDSAMPLETPEEKAARLKEEWVQKSCYDLVHPTEKAKELVGFIYDSLLSGDLPPVVTKEETK